MNAWIKGLTLAGLLAVSGMATAAEPVTLPEGTEVRLRLIDKLVSGIEGVRIFV